MSFIIIFGTLLFPIVATRRAWRHSTSYGIYLTVKPCSQNTTWTGLEFWTCTELVGGSVAERWAERAELRRRRAWVQIAAATPSGNSLRETVHTHRASIHQAAKLVAALLRVARVTAGLAERNGSLPPGLWLTLPAGWLPRTKISSATLCWDGLPLPFYRVRELEFVRRERSHWKSRVQNFSGHS